MILWRKEPLNCIIKNTVVLDDKDGYLYISVPTFEQAIRVSERFNNDILRLNQELDTPDTLGWGTDPAYQALFSKVLMAVPQVIKVLFPFLKLAYPLKLQWDMENLKEQAYGVLHQMSMMIDFNLYLSQPKEVRSGVIFQRAILEGYKDSWDVLLHSYKDDVIKIVPAAAPAPAPAPVTTPVAATSAPTAKPAPAPTPASTNTEDEEENPADAKMRALLEKVKKQHDEDKKKDAEREKKMAIERDASNNASGVKRAQVLNNVTSDAQECSDVLAEFDI